MPEIDEPMEMAVLPQHSSFMPGFVITAFVLMLLGGWLLMIWMNTSSGKDWRRASMREACAAGRAEPRNCIKEGVPMTWAVAEENQ